MNTKRFGLAVVVLVLGLCVSLAFASNIFRTETTQNLTSAPLNSTVTYSSKARVLDVFVHADAGITETVTLTFVSKTNSTYSTVLDSQALSNNTNYFYQPDGDLVLEAGDGLQIQCTNATATANIYVTVDSESY